MADFLDNLGELLVKEIKRQIILMDLVDTGDYLDSIDYVIKNGALFVFSQVEYASELEYGTFALKSSGEEDYPKTASSAKSMKKKDMNPKQAKAMPRGMIPFASFRRVLYNDKLMSSLVDEAYSQ